MPENPALRIQLFGPMDAAVGGRPLPRLRSRKGLWALALLALRHGRSVERLWLAGTLWPDSRDDQALANLRLTLTDLRHALGPEAGRIQSPTPQTLALDLHGADLDILEFDRCLESPESGLAELSKAIERRRGPLLEGCSEEWVLQEREPREARYREALERAARLALESGDCAGAIRFLRSAIAADPYRESAHRELMGLLAESGDHAAVTAVYRDLRILLRDELNAEPSCETRLLYEELRREARIRAASHTLPPEVREREQDGSSESGEEEPATRSNLPCQTTSFIGRRREIDEIKRLLSEGRLVTLTGAGGSGKTRLGVQTAGEMLPEFPDGVWMVELAPLTDPSLAARETAAAIGLREEPGKDVVELLRAFLERRRALLLLDNCEHLLKSAAELAELLLKHCADLRILTTSREPLGIGGECTFRVPTLSVPPPRYTPVGQAGEYEAVRLFVDRARSGQSGFTMEPRNADAIVRICQMLDGIPLAIELAAARVRSLAVDQIAARLDDCFRIATGGSRTALPRHQTLRALIDWSYDLLSDAERILFRRLSVFAGGWTLEAAEFVCSGGELAEPEALDLLGQLTDRSLVVFEPESGSDRYRFLEPVRQYARARLAESDEMEVVRSRHQRWFLQLARGADMHVWGTEGPELMKRIDADYDNIRAAMEFSRGGADSDASLIFGGALMHFWYAKGYWSEGRDWLDDALSRSEGTRTHSRARSLWAAAVMAWDLDNYARAEALLTECISILEEIGDDEEGSLSHALMIRGNVANAQGDYSRARACLEECRRQQESRGDRWNLVWTLYYLADVEFNAGRFDECRKLANQALTEARAVNHKWGIARSINLLGTLDAFAGDPCSALASSRESIALQEINGDRRGVGCSLLSASFALCQQAEYGAARQKAVDCLRIFADLNDRQGIALALEALARASAGMGRSGDVVRLISAARGIREAAGIACPGVYLQSNAADLERASAALSESELRELESWAAGRNIDEIVESALGPAACEPAIS